MPPVPTSGSLSSSWITAYCDGGSRGNPGPSGYGVRIEDANGNKIEELYEFLGVKTNNFAEYSGLLAALEFALARGYTHVRVVADSELMVKQMQGKYRVNSPDLRPLYDEAKRRTAKLTGFRIEHVLRGKNKHADRLANLAMDKGTRRTVHDLPLGTSAPVPSATRPAHTSGSLFPEEAPTGPSQPLKPALGFVKNGVVHFVEGEIPDGTFVTITPTRK
jgi:probable phosphoglycerate mutase